MAQSKDITNFNYRPFKALLVTSGPAVPFSIPGFLGAGSAAYRSDHGNKRSNTAISDVSKRLPR